MSHSKEDLEANGQANNFANSKYNKGSAHHAVAIEAYSVGFNNGIANEREKQRKEANTGISQEEMAIHLSGLLFMKQEISELKAKLERAKGVFETIQKGCPTNYPGCSCLQDHAFYALKELEE